MIIGIFPNMSKGSLYNFWDEFVEYLKTKNINYYIPEKYIDEFVSHNMNTPKDHFKSIEWIGSHAKYIISIGGDGSFLNAARVMSDYPVSVVGIHLGDLGFLNSITVKDYKEKIEQLIKGNYEEEKRAFLSARVISSDGTTKVFSHALNDVVIGRGRIGTMVRMNMFVNSSFVRQYPADGLVFSTATGSTGYSLSCGGPVLLPNSTQYLVVPICAHISKKFSIVLNSDDIVSITIPERQKSIDISIDGQMSGVLLHGDKLEIRVENKKISFVRFLSQNFLITLNEKL